MEQFTPSKSETIHLRLYFLVSTLFVHMSILICARFYAIYRQKMNLTKFKLQYEWTLQQIFFCGHRVLQLFCLNVEADHAIKCSQK